MNGIDLIGFIGVSLILIAYFLNLNKKLDASDIRYISLNLVGAILACLASILMTYYPFVLLEGTWTMVSLVALIRYFKKGKAGKATEAEEWMANAEYVLATVSSIESVPHRITPREIEERAGITLVLSEKDAAKLRKAAPVASRAYIS